MTTLKDNIDLLRERVAHLFRAGASAPAVDEVVEEQTEQEEHVDPFMNPVLGVYVVRPHLGRRPRRA